MQQHVEKYLIQKVEQMNDEYFMKKAIELSALAVEHGNEPFVAILVKDDKVCGDWNYRSSGIHHVFKL